MKVLMIIKSMLCIVFSLASFSTLSAGTVNYLDISQGVVIFSTDEAKALSSPSCVTNENSSKWAITLNNDNGRAIYTMLMTAMASKMRIGIETAGDCNDFNGHERPLRVWFDGSSASQPDSNLQTVAVLKTVAFGRAERTGGHGSDQCRIFKTLKSPQGDDYLFSERQRSNARYCKCRDGAALITTSYSPFGGNSGYYRNDVQCVIEIKVPVVQ